MRWFALAQRRFPGAGFSALVAACCLSATPVAAGPFGPGKFQIVEVTDRFSTSPTITIMGQNNRISKKAPSGGFYINDQGLYLEPFVEKARSDGAVSKLGFIFHNETEIDSKYGSPNVLGTPLKLTFIIDGARVLALEIARGGSDFGPGIQYNSIGQYASSAVRETGVIAVLPADMAAIARAQTIAIKVEGSTRAVTFGEKDIAKSLLANIAAFHARQIAQ